MQYQGMTPKTCRAARMLVELSQADLAERASVAMLTVRNFEAGKSAPSYKTWLAIKRALEQAGVVFLDENETSTSGGPGVRMREP